ncbi:MAG: hypothetical protein K0Q51_1185 [Rickettsiaceae bacterium]|nr:hypothetical protein [Rickettsiaceae bacterium]
MLDSITLKEFSVIASLIRRAYPSENYNPEAANVNRSEDSRRFPRIFTLDFFVRTLLLLRVCIQTRYINIMYSKFI